MISRAHEELDDPEMVRRTSSVVAGVKQESRGGGVVEGKCGDTLLSTGSVEVSFETLSEKNLRNDEARSDAEEKTGRDGVVERQRRASRADQRRLG